MFRLLLIASVFLFNIGWVIAQTGEITGQVKDETGAGVPFANVAAEVDGALVSGTSTDFDGYFTIKPLNPGKYDLKVSYIGYVRGFRFLLIKLPSWMFLSNPRKPFWA